MDNDLLDGLATEVARQIAALRVEMRRENAEHLVAVQRSAADADAALRADLAETRHRLELAQAAALRPIAADPVVALTLDAGGIVHLVQRNGEHLTMQLPNVAALVDAAADARMAATRDTLQAESQAQIARTFELFCNAPTWSPTAVYGEGQIVQTDVGRTYRVRRGVRATIGRIPGDDAEHWERLGTGGFRVLKSRPEALAPGDFFTEHDARFLHDGQATILFVPKAAKVSDIERAVKGPHGLAQATQAELRDLAARVAALLGDLQRNATAANDAGELGVQALAQMERLREDVDALQRRLDDLDAAAGGEK